jgi:hypothetical protein
MRASGRVFLISHHHPYTCTQCGPFRFVDGRGNVELETSDNGGMETI